MRVVIAPDKFKGTLSAGEAAAAMAVGVRSAFPRAEVDLVPVADGGEGTCELLLQSLGGDSRSVGVTDPLRRPIDASVSFLGNRTIGVEMAAASGLWMLEAQERDALRASSRGTGELARLGSEFFPDAHSLMFFIGGSASTDAGTGAARAFGWRFLDAAGRELPEGGGSLIHLAHLEPPDQPPSLSVLGAYDVTSPLTGPGGAAQLFAPQKGGSPNDVAQLEEGLGRLDSLVSEQLGFSVAELEGAGAGGGMGAGVVAFFNGRLVSGFDLVAEAVRLQEAIDAADLVLTGEGRFDEQSLLGKSCGRVAGLARAAAVPCLAVVGSLALSAEAVAEAGFARVVRSEGLDPDPARALVAATKKALVEL
jgi:glycerate 2-kinase